MTAVVQPAFARGRLRLSRITKVTLVTFITPRRVGVKCMGQINMQIPDDVHEELKVKATRNGRDLKDEIKDALSDHAGVEV